MTKLDPRKVQSTVMGCPLERAPFTPSFLDRYVKTSLQQSWFLRTCQKNLLGAVQIQVLDWFFKKLEAYTTVSPTKDVTEWSSIQNYITKHDNKYRIYLVHCKVHTIYTKRPMYLRLTMSRPTLGISLLTTTKWFQKCPLYHFLKRTNV